MIGGGSLPEESLPSVALAVRVASPSAAAAALRRSAPAVIARIEHDMVLLDPRTVDPEDDQAVLDALTALTM